jgi:hypothetical protein
MTTSRIAIRIATVAAAVTVAAATLGCGMIQNAVDTAGTLGEFSDRLGRAAELTYTARYRSDAGEVTLVQEPPRTAVLTEGQRLIFTPEAVTICDAGECQQAPSSAAVSGAANPGLVASVAGAGFLTPELALSLVAAAALVPGSDVSTSDREIAGQPSLCADVSGVQDPQGTQAGDMVEFSVCVTESGVLSAFSGKTSGGDKAAIELTEFTETADPGAFKPPADATVVDVTDLRS